MKEFGGDIANKMTWGGKYKFQVNDVPPPGYYNPERGDSQTKQRNPEYIIHEETMVSLDTIQVYSRETSPRKKRGMK